VNRCRSCNQTLTEVDSPAGRVPGCTSCNHRLLDHVALEDLQRGVRRIYTPVEVRLLEDECKERKRDAVERAVVYLDCPGCGNQLLRRTFGRLSFLLVHFCATHGYWIYENELAGIADYLERGGELLELEHARQEIEEQLRDAHAKHRELRQAAANSQAFVPLLFM
jgi:predicted RNA-binding Zn-ribbon protein involved in translation (DUF1610 family)